MSDIIQDAKKLLDGATPAPWEPHADQPKCLVNLETQFAVAVVPESDIQGSEDESNRNLIAAAPELAQALAEETYEYSVQIKDHTGEWETATNSETHLEEWWESKKHAEGAMAEEQEFGEHCRIVRRRVSSPEVINE